MFTPTDISGQESEVGAQWTPYLSHPVDFGAQHFLEAMLNVISQPNINSSVIMRADIISDSLNMMPNIMGTEQANQGFIFDTHEGDKGNTKEGEETDKNEETASTASTAPTPPNLQDYEPRQVEVTTCPVKRVIVRRIIPRNPQNDFSVNQTCIVHSDRDLWDKDGKETSEGAKVAISYISHHDHPTSCPYYLPCVKAVLLYFDGSAISVYYEKYTDYELSAEQEERGSRIALHLLHTVFRHSSGQKAGYKKRVHHDMIIDRIKFQDRYIYLKQKHAHSLVSKWVESTDPRKHVFEDLAIAAFLIELWGQMYKNKDDIYFYDLGCGNGLLVNILIKEGYVGEGVDARARKSWLTYEPEVTQKLLEKIVVPTVLLDQMVGQAQYLPPHAAEKRLAEANSLATDPRVFQTAGLPENAFLIGNHSDELTCWIPLMDRPFMVIPCCSHALSGEKKRFPPTSSDPEEKSTYRSLVGHVEQLSSKIGWQVEKEYLRIPSTRNAAVIGRTRVEPQLNVFEILYSEGGGEGWVERARDLCAKSPRNH